MLLFLPRGWHAKGLETALSFLTQRTSCKIQIKMRKGQTKTTGMQDWRHKWGQRIIWTDVERSNELNKRLMTMAFICSYLSPPNGQRQELMMLLLLMMMMTTTLMTAMMIMNSARHPFQEHLHIEARPTWQPLTEQNGKTLMAKVKQRLQPVARQPVPECLQCHQLSGLSASANALVSFEGQG